MPHAKTPTHTETYEPAKADGHAPMGESLSTLQGIMRSFGGVSVLVVGDLILDKYTIGRPTRISREAPIAVLEHVRDYVMPGGGTSPACTISSLGGEAHLAG